MSFDTAAVPTLALAGFLSFTGDLTQRKVQSRSARTVLLLLGLAAAIPGVFILL